MTRRNHRGINERRITEIKPCVRTGLEAFHAGAETEESNEMIIVTELVDVAWLKAGLRHLVMASGGGCVPDVSVGLVGSSSLPGNPKIWEVLW